MRRDLKLIGLGEKPKTIKIRERGARGEALIKENIFGTS